MKRLLILLAFLLLPSSVLAAPSSVDRITDHIEPLIKSDYIKGQYFWATSTTASSSFPNLISTNATSTNATTTNLRISGFLSFNGVIGSTWAAFCTTITGGAGLCDGSDDGSGGGLSSYDAWTHPSAGVSATTSQMIFNSASSTFTGGLSITGNATATNATTTNLRVSSVLNAVTGVFTNLFIGADTIAEYISDTVGAMFSGNTETGVAVTYQDGDNTIDVVCDTANSSTFGCLSSSDWTTFNNKLSSYDPFTHPAAGQSATTSTMIFTTGGLVVNAASSTIAGNLTITGNSTTTNATTTNIAVSGGLTFGGVTGTLWSTFCTSITGSSDLCDGSDASGAGGGSGNVATSSPETTTRVPFWTSTNGTPALLSGGSSGFTWNSTNSLFTATNASTTRLTVESWMVSTTTTVCSRNCQYSSIQSAINDGYTDIRLKAETYAGPVSITRSDTTLRGAGMYNTLITCDAATNGLCVSIATSSSLTRITLEDFGIDNTNASKLGTGLDTSMTSNVYVNKVRITDFDLGQLTQDGSAQQTFYHSYENMVYFDNNNCFRTASTTLGTVSNNLVNDHSMLKPRCRIADTSTNGIGYNIVNSEGWTLYSPNSEPGSVVGTGLRVDGTSIGITVISPWFESNATGTEILSGALNTKIIGGRITSNTRGIWNRGTRTSVDNTLVTANTTNIDDNTVLGTYFNTSSTYNGPFLGLGTSTASTTHQKLGLTISTSDGLAEALIINNTGAFASAYSGLALTNSTGGFTNAIAKIGAEPGSGYADSRLMFHVADSSKNLQERARFDVDGDLGIGTTSPLSRLSVGTAGSAFRVTSAGAIAEATGITSSGTITFSGISDGCLNITSGVVGSTGAACGSGGSSAFEVATTSDIAVPQLAYITRTSGRTTLGSVATGTISSANTALTVTGNRYTVGGATTFTIATTSTNMFTGTAGQVLAFTGGGWTGVATTTFGTGLTYSAGNVTVNTSQNISTLSNLTSDGVVYTSGGAGTLNVDTSGLDVARGGTGQTTLTQNQLLYGVGTGAVQSVATSTLSLGTGLTVSAGSLGFQVGGSNATIGLATIAANSVLGNITGAAAVPSAISTTSLFAGTNGQVLGFSNGAWTGVATTTFSGGLVYSAGNVTANCVTITGSAALCDGDDATGGGSLSGGSAHAIASWVDATTLTATSTLNFTAFTATSTTATSTVMGTFSVGSTTPFSNCFFCIGSSSPLIHTGKDGKTGFGAVNTGPTKYTFGPGSNANVNPNVNFLVQDTADARLGGSVNNRFIGMKTGLSSTPGIFAFDYTAGSALNLQLQEFGGNVGVASSTPWGMFSAVKAASLDPILAFATSTTAQAYFKIFATSTSNTRGAKFVVNHPDDTLPTDTFLLNGSINTRDWKKLECNTEFAKKTAQNTADITGSVISTTLGGLCGDFSIIEDTNGVADYVVTTGSGYTRFRPGTAGTVAVSGDGIGYSLTTAFMTVGTSTPILETVLRPGAMGNASTSIYLIGFGNQTGVSADYATLPTSYIGFVASSTQANWRGVVNSAGTMTVIDTGVATSSVNTGDAQMRRFRVEVEPTRILFYIQSAANSPMTLVGSVTTNIPASTILLNPVVSTAKATGGLSNELHVNHLQVWYRDPLWR